MNKTVFACIALSGTLCSGIMYAVHEYKSSGMIHRKPDYQIDSLFVERWSPRAMSGETITKTELMQLFEAARWAPSSYNTQPWHFVYALRDTKEWTPIFDLLVPFNQGWAKNASALVVVISRNQSKAGKPTRTHSICTGAAWQNCALQATAQGLVTHAMEGFDYDRAKTVLKIPNEYTIELIFAVGKPGKLKDLPKEMRDGEVPSDRKKVEEFVSEGVFVVKK